MMWSLWSTMTPLGREDAPFPNSRSTRTSQASALSSQPKCQVATESETFYLFPGQQCLQALNPGEPTLLQCLQQDCKPHYTLPPGRAKETRSLGTVLPGAGGVALLPPALEPWGVVLALSKPCFPHQLDSDSSTYGNCKLKVCSPQIIMMMMMIIKGQKRTLEDFYGLDCSDSFPDVYVSPNSWSYIH